MDEKLAIFYPFDFQMGRDYLRFMMEVATNDFLEKGNKITQCRPAFAVGCEIRPAVRQAIRRGR